MKPNNISQKNQHSLAVLRFLAQNGPSTQILVTLAGQLKRTSVFNLFEDMAAAGLLELNENIPAVSGKGRPRQLWTLRPGLGCFFSVYVNKHIRGYALSDFAGRQLAAGVENSSHAGLETELDWIHALLRKWHRRYRIAGVMLIIPGRVDFEHGFVHVSRSWGLEKAALRDMLRAKLADIAPDALFVIENNARMCTWGQRYGGVCTGLKDYMALMFVDGLREEPRMPIGIGSGMVLNGSLFRGHSGGAGELDRECYRWYEKLYQGKNYPVSLLELDHGTRRSFARSLGESFAHLVNYLEPQRLAVVFEQSPAVDFFYVLREELYGNLLYIDPKQFSIEISSDGINSTVRGGQALLKSLFWEDDARLLQYLQECLPCV